MRVYHVQNNIKLKKEDYTKLSQQYSFLPQLKNDYKANELAYNELYMNATDTDNQFFSIFTSTNDLTTAINVAIWLNKIGLKLDKSFQDKNDLLTYVNNKSKTFDNAKHLNQILQEFAKENLGIRLLELCSEENITNFSKFLIGNEISFNLMDFLKSTNFTKDIISVLMNLYKIKNDNSDANTLLAKIMSDDIFIPILKYIKIPQNMENNKSYAIKIWNAKMPSWQIDEEHFDKKFPKDKIGETIQHALNFNLFNSICDLGVTELTEEAYSVILKFKIPDYKLGELTLEKKSEMQEQFLQHILQPENKAVLKCLNYSSYFWVWKRYLQNMTTKIPLNPLEIIKVLKDAFMNFISKSNNFNRDLNSSIYHSLNNRDKDKSVYYSVTEIK